MKWLPQGHIVIVDTIHRSESSVVIGWMNAYGTTSIAEIIFEEKFIDILQEAMEAQDTNLLNSYMEKLETHVLTLAAAHEDGDSEPWHLTNDIL